MKRPTATFGTVELDGIQSTAAVVFDPSTQILTNIGFADRPVTEGHNISHLIITIMFVKTDRNDALLQILSGHSQRIKNSQSTKSNN